MKNAVREKLQNGEQVLGMFFETGSMPVVECMALGGLDYIIIDTEHGPYETESVGDFICAAKRRGLTPFVRAKDASRPAILKNLDIGAMGLIIPNIHSIEEVEQVVKYGKYFPDGERGVCFTRGNGFGCEKEQTLTELFAEHNRETMLIPQCETLGCLAEIEKIAAMPGVDGIFIGPYDLSTAMGIPGEFGGAEFREALDRIKNACHDAGKPVFIYAGTKEKMKEAFAEGYDSVTYSMDAALIIDAVKELVASR